MTRVIPWALAATAALALIVALALTSSAYGRAKERQITYDYLNEALFAPERLHPILTWRPASAPLVRPFTEGDQQMIARALTESWSAFSAAQHLGEPGLLSDYFSGIALERARLAAQDAHQTGTRMVVLGGVAEPVFYHLDGSVLQLRSTLLVARFAQADGGLAQFRLTRDTTLTTLMNESSGWRVFAHERHATSPVAPPMRAEVGRIGRLAGINYYPAQTPWRDFWPSFDAGIIARDFANIQTLGANAIRVFLPRDAFLDTQNSPRHLTDLATLLDLAQAHGLTVVPTLFDMRNGYAPTDWPDDLRYLRAVLPVLRDHPAVSFVDLKNEPDLDFAPHGRAQVEAWLHTMILLSRDMAPDLPLTVGWATHADALTLAESLDLLSYHDYAATDQSAPRLADIRAAARGKPVMITEIGESSYTLALGFPGSPDQQAARLAARMEALAPSDGLFIWALSDFPDPDPDAVGHSAWVRNLQANFGLFDADGHPKPAAKTVADFFTTFLTGAF